MSQISNHTHQRYWVAIAALAFWLFAQGVLTGHLYDFESAHPADGCELCLKVGAAKLIGYAAAPLITLTGFLGLYFPMALQVWDEPISLPFWARGPPVALQSL